MPRFVRPFVALSTAALLLTACGGLVAPDAPDLLHTEEIAARTASTTDQTRGARQASALAWRAERLRERAARLRRTGVSDAERQRLLRRADELKQH